MSDEERIFKELDLVKSITNFISDESSLEDGKYINVSMACNVLLASIYSIILTIQTDPMREEEYQKIISSYIKSFNIDILDIIKEYKRKPTDPSLN